jgi:hypothetical protein
MLFAMNTSVAKPATLNQPRVVRRFGGGLDEHRHAGERFWPKKFVALQGLSRCATVARMELLADIRDCAIAAFSYWQSYVTGGGIIALIVLWEKLANRPLPRWTYLVLFLVVFVLMSFFLAWRDEHRKAALLDDRAHQQRAANEYSPLLDRGRKIMVTWVDAIAKKDDAMIATQRTASFEWLKTVRSRLDSDFGAAVASRFNLGKPDGLPLGMSEPQEHEARVIELDRLIQEMRAGQLHLRVAG